MMAVTSSHRRWTLGPGQYLDVVRTDVDDAVIFAIGEEREGSSVQERLRFKLTIPQAMRLARFLGNVSTLDPESAFDTDDTKPE